MPHKRLGIPKAVKKHLYVIVHKRMYYWHRGLWPSRADAVRNADDLPPAEVEIRRCWVAPER